MPDTQNRYRAEMRCRPIEHLIRCFNEQVGNPGWVGARGEYLETLREALLATGKDCSTFIGEEGMSLARRITLRATRIEPVGDP